MIYVIFQVFFFETANHYDVINIYHNNNNNDNTDDSPGINNNTNTDDNTVYSTDILDEADFTTFYNTSQFTTCIVNVL